eukprot:6194051-Pleurochrysis_carterae.AAC.1
MGTGRGAGDKFPHTPNTEWMDGKQLTGALLTSLDSQDWKTCTRDRHISSALYLFLPDFWPHPTQCVYRSAASRLREPDDVERARVETQHEDPLLFGTRRRGLERRQHVPLRAAIVRRPRDVRPRRRSRTREHLRHTHFLHRLLDRVRKRQDVRAVGDTGRTRWP